MLNLFSFYELDTYSRDLSTKFAIGDCLFGAVKLTRNDDSDKYGYSAYDIAFERRSICSMN